MFMASLAAAKIHLLCVGLLSSAIFGSVFLHGCSSDDGGGQTRGAGGATSTGTGGTGSGGDSAPAMDAGPTKCDELVARCQPVNQDAGSALRCVALGMQGDVAACETGYADCRTQCGGALCRRIGSLCHDKEQTCHEMGHANMPNPCFDRALECLEACK
jgi:hypothetical protein